MRTHVCRSAVLMAALALFGGGRAWAKIGLSTQFVDAEIEGLKPGLSYNIRELRGVPYTVKNRGDDSAEVLIEGVVPATVTLQAPYEPISDASWIRCEPARISIGPDSLGFCDLILEIPDDPALTGRHFQGLIWSHTVNTGRLAAGVKTRVRFSIGPGPETIESVRREQAMVTLNYDLWPTAMYVQKAMAGRSYDLRAQEKKAFLITNRNEDDLEVVLAATPWPKGSIALPSGYDYVEDLSWVSFDTATVKVEGLRVKDIAMAFNAPESLKGKKVAFIVQVRLPIGTVINSTHRVFVTFEP